MVSALKIALPMIIVQLGRLAMHNWVNVKVLIARIQLTALVPVVLISPLALIRNAQPAQLPLVTPQHAPLVNSAPLDQPILLKLLMNPESAMPLNATPLEMTAMLSPRLAMPTPVFVLIFLALLIP